MVEITLHPIGTVRRNPGDEGLSGRELRARPARIELDPGLEPALLGLAPGDAVLVVFYFHESGEHPLQVHPRGDPNRPLRGVFSTRSPVRPNPIGVTTVRIERIEGTNLEVIGLDAIDGTPVLDMKSHAPVFDTPDTEKGD
jgi:tRNA-Thr(GGU) m(6)t(6)A37 methyltransferase TsaA